MSEMEKGFILGSLSQMDQASKNFVLGYMAGRCSNVVEHEKDRTMSEAETKGDEKEKSPHNFAGQGEKE